MQYVIGLSLRGGPHSSFKLKDKRQPEKISFKCSFSIVNSITIKSRKSLIFGITGMFGIAIL